MNIDGSVILKILHKNNNNTITNALTAKSKTAHGTQVGNGYVDITHPRIIQFC